MIKRVHLKCTVGWVLTSIYIWETITSVKTQTTLLVHFCSRLACLPCSSGESWSVVINWFCVLCVRAQLFSHVRLFVTLWTVALQAPLSMGFSRQKCWSGLPFSSPGDLPHSGIESMSPALAERFFIGWATREALFIPSPCNKFNQVIHRQENEDRMVHLYTAKLPSAESEQNNASDNSMDG